MNYYLQALITAKPLDGSRHLAVVFADGFSAYIDLAPWIARGGLRAKLNDPLYFRSVLVNDEGVPEWPGGVDLSPGTLRVWCEAGRVLTKEETDAWIARVSEKTEKVA